MAGQILQSQMKKSQNQSQQYNLAKEGSVINIKAISSGKGKMETGRSLTHLPLAPSIFQATSVLPSATVPNSAPSFRENTFLSTAKLATRSKRKQKGGGNGLMIIAIMHLLLACGLIDLGMFLAIRFNHYGHIWPDSYAKLSVSEYRLYRNQILSIRVLYSPVTIAIGLMIFFPKSIYLLIIFISKVSFCRAAIVDGSISFLALTYACITGTHAYVVLHNISMIDIEESSDILCYAIRGPREKAPQELRDRCLLAAYKMFGNHLSLQSIIAILWTGCEHIGMVEYISSCGTFVHLSVIPLLTFVVLYAWYVKRHSCVNHNMAKGKRPSTSIRMCYVFGSGGHTAELLTLISAFRQQFGHRIYIVSDTDKLSGRKIIEFEKSQSLGNFRVERISRSREVKQNYITSIWTTIWACIESLFLIWRIRPDAIICNGPGVCLPICFAAALFDLLRLHNVQLFYIESLCRVKKLSVTGQILYKLRIPDIFFVHWEDLVHRYPRVFLIPCTGRVQNIRYVSDSSGGYGCGMIKSCLRS
uniref:UDP-N-acetylglucosamine transferase subunit ALG14 n=2 Tax=Brugia malayi TaxID=6279 RepID=A0A0H5S6L5_BRUMA|nr:BMA-HPO-16 [Brugia malayi]